MVFTSIRSQFGGGASAMRWRIRSRRSYAQDKINKIHPMIKKRTCINRNSIASFHNLMIRIHKPRIRSLRMGGGGG